MAINLEELRKYGKLDLLAKQAVEGFITGMHKSPYHGFSVEFAEHKLYNAGESTRHIDWKVYGRTDRLYTKRYEEETNLRCHILVDVSSSMYYPEKSSVNKIQFAVEASASLAYLLQKQRDAVALTTFANKVELSTVCKSTPRHLNYLIQELNKISTEKVGDKKTNVTANIHAIADRIPRRSLVVIFSDMFDDPEQSQELLPALQHLKHKKHEVILFHVLDKKTEVDFVFENRPYQFTDIETGEKIKLNPTQIKEEYTKAIHEYKQDLKVRCGQYKIEYVEVDIQKGIDQILVPYLVKRAKMK